MNRVLMIFGAAFIFALSPAQSAQAQDAKKPNILVI